jgi:hypothetical protein
VRRLKDLGLLERHPRKELYEGCNTEIEALNRGGLSAGQIAKRFGMSKGAVKAVLRRRKRRGYPDRFSGVG